MEKGIGRTEGTGETTALRALHARPVRKVRNRVGPVIHAAAELYGRARAHTSRCSLFYDRCHIYLMLRITFSLYVRIIIISTLYYCVAVNVLRVM